MLKKIKQGDNSKEESVIEMVTQENGETFARSIGKIVYVYDWN